MKALASNTAAVATDVWGILSSIDIYNCNPVTIRDAGEIRRFVAELCEIIGMKRFGETQVVHFGEEERVAGFSMVQLIETSLISAHFANLTNTAYLDVFSCKPYEPEEVQKFAEAFFGGEHSLLSVTLRR
jgi:S-adenosylmethionine/arginine decarboxylase-like enzyme